MPSHTQAAGRIDPGRVDHGTSTPPAEASAQHVPLSAPRRRQQWWQSQRLLGVISILFVLAAWEIVGQFFVTNAAFFVPVSDVASDLWEWITSGDILSALSTSAQEFAIGFGLACVIGLALGFAMGLSRTVWGLLNPLVSALNATPLLALTPLFIIWFGIGITSKALMIMFIASFPIIINTAAGTREVEQAHLDAARSFGASQWQLITKVRLPSALSFIIAGLRMAVARALVGIFVVELFGSLDGIGFAISNAATVFDTPRVFAGIVLLSGLGVIASIALTKLEQTVAPWRVQRDKGKGQ
ncbi:ABC transporter permease [Conexibacter sp. CPCC 206217]|uniref:ABC transporter permease n=1 Tax=Conexibacter sp. CPCC 206217 TaxID=3064574 RepID=UPI002722A8FD|nr:ABC transporter permease [Conexibacter sp. CPCC 206217]MDO8208894.1 ABC transporter permease [Conexibacter sp. CPCC 206217]